MKHDIPVNFLEYDLDPRVRLQNILLEHNVNQSQLSIAIGVSRFAINRYINGSREMDLDTALKIAKYLKVELDDIYEVNCLFCNTKIKSCKYSIDRYGNLTTKRKKTDDVYKIYDCPKCGYIEITNMFEYIVLDGAGLTSGVEAIEKVIHELRETYFVPWHEVITITTNKDEYKQYLDLNVLIESVEYIGKIQYSYNKQNVELLKIGDDESWAKVDLDPETYEYSITKKVK